MDWSGYRDSINKRAKKLNKRIKSDYKLKLDAFKQRRKEEGKKPKEITALLAKAKKKNPPRTIPLEETDKDELIETVEKLLIECSNILLVEAEVEIACIDEVFFKPTLIPNKIKELMETLWI